jgi:RNA polymerase sigma-70 factor (family 1)
MQQPETDNHTNLPHYLLKEEKMFELVFKSYFPRLKAFARKFVSDDSIAEDVVQEVFLKVWENRNQIKGDTFHSYIFTITRNLCINYLKRGKILHIYTGEEALPLEGLFYADFFSDPHQLTIYNELKNEIAKVFETLPIQTKTVFELSRFKGLKNQEIAVQLGISTRTVEKHITRALNKFKLHFSNSYPTVLLFLLISNNF